jgi:hypothetical protein
VALPPGARCRPQARLNHAPELLPILQRVLTLADADAAALSTGGRIYLLL